MKRTDGKTVLVLDTETLGVADARVYDLGYVIVNLADGKVLKARDYIVREIYDNERLMKTAYYYSKKPIYERRLADGYCKKINWSYALRVLARDLKKYKVDGIYAYNSPFDVRAIAKTCETYGTRNPLADGITDIWKGIVDPHITQTEDYKNFCVANGFMTKHKKPRCQAKAETLFRYITGQTDYIEEHTALEDSKIEFEVLRFALTRM